MHKTKVIPGFLSQSQLSQINQWVDSYDSSHDIVTAPIGRYIGVDPRVTDLLVSLIPRLPNEVLFIRILEATSPGGPHADNSIPSPRPDPMPNFARTFIIPLYTQETSTIVFDQTMSPGQDLFEHMQSLPLLDTRQSVGQVTGRQYLSHTGREWLDRLSINCLFPWHAGDLLIFDRSRIHCSDNWQTNGISVKRGFVIWSEIQA